MEFSREVSDALTIHSFEPGRIRVGEDWHSGNLIISRDRIIAPWEIDDPAAITKATLAQAIDLTPEILLIGTGRGYVMSDMRVIGELARSGIGAEIMDTAAACRTYNVLVHEQRSVVAALYNT